MRPHTVQATILIATLSLGTWGCATKKHVHEAIAPVQQQVNQVQRDTEANKAAIGDLDRRVAMADEKASDAARRAQDAIDAAAQANSAAQEAGNRAYYANGLAERAISSANQVRQELQSLNNYTLSQTARVYFRVGQSTLSKEAKDQLDQAVTKASAIRSYIIEVKGFTDHSGSKAYNLDLARRLADVVARYITIQKGIPLRNVRVLGVGSEFPNAVNRTSAQRYENRHVDVKIYSLNLDAQVTAEVRSVEARTQRNDRQMPSPAINPHPEASSPPSTPSTRLGSFPRQAWRSIVTRSAEYAG